MGSNVVDGLDDDLQHFAVELINFGSATYFINELREDNDDCWR